ncbi:MAG TPA: protein kinase [Actinomycetota bacterium]|nr:protein kinase [Actinomycetota bacterium]
MLQDRRNDTDTTPHPPSAPGAGTLLGDRYELIEVAGTGGFSEVWRANDHRLGREVAVKLLAGPAARDPVHINRIEREARALAALSHPGVVHVYDWGEHSDAAGSFPYIVMELVDGPDLAAHLAAFGPMAPQEAVVLLDLVLRGVQEAHDVGVIHGDVKPANIYISSHGPKIGDFGVARILSEETGTTMPATTPAYAAPEVLRGERPTGASDVYAAGCVAYELLSGRPPYQGESFWDIARRHLEDEPAPLQGQFPGVTGPLDRVIQSALAKDPGQRPPSAASFADALRQAVGLPGAGESIPGAAGVPTGTTPLDANQGTPTTVVASPPATEVLPRGPSRPAIDRRVWLVPLAAGVFLLALILLAAGRGGKPVEVPNFVSMKEREAAAAAEKAGLQTATRGVSLGGAAGVVALQSPEPGQTVERGTVVSLGISDGRSVVPEVVGRQLTESQAALERLALVPDVVRVLSAGAQPGTVLKTSPGPGTIVKPGSKVVLTVAASPPPPQPAPADHEDRDRDEGKGNGKGRGKDDD